MTEGIGLRSYGAGIDIRNRVGVTVGSVEVDSIPDASGPGSRLTLRAHTGRPGESALVQLWLEPIELRELAGALRLAADHAERARRRAGEAVASGEAPGASDGHLERSRR
jgi:hypothetical protein